MLRFVKSSKETLRLGEAFFDNLTRNINVHKQIVAFTTINNVRKSATPVFNINVMKISTSATTTCETDAALEEPNIAEVAGGDPESEHKLRVLILEAEVMRQEGKAVPNNSSIKTHNWQELLKLPSKSARRRYLEFLFKVEKKKENRLKKKEQKRLEWEQSPKPEKDVDEVLNHDLGHNNFFLRFYDTKMNQMYNNRLIQAMQFGQKLIVDCGYHENMTSRENTNCAKQLMLLFAENRFNDEPFDLHYCNATHDSSLIRGLHKFIGTMYEPWFPLNLHEQSYLDVFPKENLIYLTPHCRDVMKEFDHDAIYIIGALVDKVNNEPLSLAKAKKEGLRMVKLPLDHYLEWGAGSGKSLTINQVASILLDIKSTGDWKYALRHVPRRKLAEFSLGSALRKFNNRLSYSAEAQHPKNSTWKPNNAGKNLDNLSYKPKRTYTEEKEHKSSVRRLVDVRKVINK